MAAERIGPQLLGEQTDKKQSPGGGMAYAGDLKSPVRKGLWVRLPPRAPNLPKDRRSAGQFYFVSSPQNCLRRSNFAEVC